MEKKYIIYVIQLDYSKCKRLCLEVENNNYKKHALKGLSI